MRTSKCSCEDARDGNECGNSLQKGRHACGDSGEGSDDGERMPSRMIGAGRIQAGALAGGQCLSARFMSPAWRVLGGQFIASSPVAFHLPPGASRREKSGARGAVPLHIGIRSGVGSVLGFAASAPDSAHGSESTAEGGGYPFETAWDPELCQNSLTFALLQTLTYLAAQAYCISEGCSDVPILEWDRELCILKRLQCECPAPPGPPLPGGGIDFPIPNNLLDFLEDQNDWWAEHEASDDTGME